MLLSDFCDLRCLSVRKIEGYTLPNRALFLRSQKITLILSYSPLFYAKSGIGVYPTRLGDIVVVRHDDDCPIRGQACEIRLGGKVAVGGPQEERL